MHGYILTYCRENQRVLESNIAPSPFPPDKLFYRRPLKSILPLATQPRMTADEFITGEVVCAQQGASPQHIKGGCV